ncbi:MAG TPA: hypothetical protein VN834_07900, partial [Candidatus Acidoferrum sp.]|nr:hypothetical protein [Candidatus Acidoferrum sp.]
MPDPGIVLTRNWLHFGQILRGLGFDAGPARMLPFLRTLTVIDLRRPDDVRTAVHAHFGRRREELPVLDRALVAFLRAEVRASDGSASAEAEAEAERGEPLTLTGRQLRVLDDDSEDAEGAEEQEVASYSQVEVLRQKDFDTLTEAEMAEVRRLIRLMRLPAGLTRSRRARAGGHDELDIRRLLRRSMRFGGELLVFSWKSPRLRPRPL